MSQAIEYIIKELESLKIENAKLLSDYVKEREENRFLKSLIVYEEESNGDGKFCLGKNAFIWEGVHSTADEYKRLKELLLGAE
jgi:NDP-sugar pyrophosphorylase family protein